MIRYAQRVLLATHLPHFALVAPIRVLRSLLCVCQRKSLADNFPGPRKLVGHIFFRGPPSQFDLGLMITVRCCIGEAVLWRGGEHMSSQINRGGSQKGGHGCDCGHSVSTQAEWQSHVRRCDLAHISTPPLSRSPSSSSRVVLWPAAGEESDMTVVGLGWTTR